MMLQKNKSQRIKLIKYGLSAPLFILMLILSSATISNSKAVETIHNKAEAVFASPAKAVLADTTYKTTIVTYDPKTDKLPADTIPEENKTQVFTAVEQSPGFPGGEAAFSRYLGKNIKYPAEAKKNKVEGRAVLTFVVEKDGSLTGIKVLRSLGSGTDEEAIRVLKASPKWKPGIQNGRKVRVQYSVPITFSLGNKLTSTGEPARSEGSQVFTAVEQSPVFPGGDKAFSKWLGLNVKYPKAAREANIQGRVVVTFIVEKDGSLSDIKVVRGVSPDIDAEALRVMGNSPAWKPGTQNGRKVRVAYSVPINFALEADDDNATKTGYNPVKDLADTSNVTPLIKIRNGYGTAPLYVLNGNVISQERMSVLPPSEIESMTVLKDKSAIALYGKNGENGVVLITTKKKKIYIK